MRALYQRKAGRDLFDLATALKSPDVKPDRIVETFLKYLEHEGHRITRADFEENLAAKMRDPEFLADISPLLAPGYAWDPEPEAAAASRLIEMLPGEPSKGGAESNTV